MEASQTKVIKFMKKFDIITLGQWRSRLGEEKKEQV